MAKIPKMPDLLKIIQFSKPFLKMLTRKARDMHVNIIVRTSTNPDGNKFLPLSKKYKKFKADKYNSTKANLKASGLMFSHFQPEAPKKTGSTTYMTYAIKGNAAHERDKLSGEIMNYHQEGAGHNKKRDIAGQTVLHKETQEELARLIVNQIDKNIEKTLAPYVVELKI